MLIEPPEPVADLFCRAYRAGLAFKDVLERAEISRTTWWRFETRRTSPRLDQLEAVSRSIDEMIALETPPAPVGVGSPDPGPSPATTEETRPHGA